jgi:hypothetical protein
VTKANLDQPTLWPFLLLLLLLSLFHYYDFKYEFISYWIFFFFGHWLQTMICPILPIHLIKRNNLFSGKKNWFKFNCLS